MANSLLTESWRLTFEWRSMIFDFDDPVDVEFVWEKYSTTSREPDNAVGDEFIYSIIEGDAIARRYNANFLRPAAAVERNGGNGWWKEISQKCNSASNNNALKDDINF